MRRYDRIGDEGGKAGLGVAAFIDADDEADGVGLGLATRVRGLFDLDLKKAATGNGDRGADGDRRAVESRGGSEAGRLVDGEGGVVVVELFVVDAGDVDGSLGGRGEKGNGDEGQEGKALHRIGRGETFAQGAGIAKLA